MTTVGLSRRIALTVPEGGGGWVTFGTTVTVALEDFPYAVTVMVAVPTAMAFTTPFSPDPATVTIDGALLVQLNTSPPAGMAPTSVACALSVACSVSARTRSCASRSRPTRPGWGSTSTAIEADFPSTVAVMVTLPGPTAVSTPVWETVAMAGSLVVQPMVQPPAGAGDGDVTVAESVRVVPTATNLEIGIVTATDETTGFTVTGTDADFPPAVAVMVAAPALSAVSVPGPDTATLGASLDCQVVVHPP